MHKERHGKALQFRELKAWHDASIWDVKLSEYNSIFVTATLNPINLKTIYFKPFSTPHSSQKCSTEIAD